MPRTQNARAALSLAAACAAFQLTHSPAIAQVTIDWVTVGYAANAADPTTGFGSVGYKYRIGATEVTNAQYAAFLNSVAASDPNGLYNTSMGSDARGGITRSGSDGSYTYAVKANMGDKPVNFVSWYDAARFCNWLTNGQPSGGGGAESGVYTLDGADSISAITRDLTNPNQVFIPTENEWYKAAYHQPASQGGDADGYWLYATQSNSAPTVATATATGDVANPGANVVNYLTAADWNGEDGNVTTVGSAGNSSFHGAFDMNGNVGEWNETELANASRGLRGGSWGSSVASLQATFRSLNGVPTNETVFFAFRVASPAGCPGDTNGDEIVDFTDLNTVLTAFGAAGPDLPADLSCDGLVSFTDLNILLSAFGSNCLD